MGEKGFFILFAILIVAMFVVGTQNGGFGATATSTSATTTEMATFGTVGRAPVFSQGNVPEYGAGGGTSGSGTTGATAPARPNREVQAELERLYDEFWELEQKVDSAQRQQPASRYVGKVRLERSASSNTDPDREYLTLTVNQGVGAIDISDWYLESYVTDERVAIPDGTEVYRDGGAINRTRAIVLNSGQRAYLITGESPVNTSFQENMCIGYLRTEENFVPNVSRNCPAPRELLRRFSNVELDEDSCWEFIDRQWGCNMIDDSHPEFDDLSGVCRRFIEDYLSYNSCIDQFSWRTDFHKDNDWYIYFERDEELWRSKREIIRLLDQYDQVVAVIEYY